MVILEAFNNEKLVVQKELTIYDYYDEENPLVDEPKYRKSNNITRLVISIYYDTENTQLDTKTEIFYDENGNHLSDKVITKQ